MNTLGLNTSSNKATIESSINLKADNKANEVENIDSANSVSFENAISQELNNTQIKSDTSIKVEDNIHHNSELLDNIIQHFTDSTPDDSSISVFFKKSENIIPTSESLVKEITTIFNQLKLGKLIEQPSNHNFNVKDFSQSSISKIEAEKILSSIVGEEVNIEINKETKLLNLPIENKETNENIISKLIDITDSQTKVKIKFPAVEPSTMTESAKSITANQALQTSNLPQNDLQNDTIISDDKINQLAKNQSLGMAENSRSGEKSDTMNKKFSGSEVILENNFEHNLETKISTKFENQISEAIENTTLNSIRVKEIPNIIAKMTTGIGGNGSTSARLVLNPQSLGTVFVEIQMKDDVAKIKINVENEKALDKIESTIHLLKEKLNNDGISKIDVEVKKVNKEEEQSYFSGKGKEKNENSNDRKETLSHLAKLAKQNLK